MDALDYELAEKRSVKAHLKVKELKDVKYFEPCDWLIALDRLEKQLQKKGLGFVILAEGATKIDLEKLPEQIESQIASERKNILQHEGETAQDTFEKYRHAGFAKLKNGDIAQYHQQIDQQRNKEKQNEVTVVVAPSLNALLREAEFVQNAWIRMTNEPSN